MIPELETLRANQLPDAAVDAAARYLANPDSSTPPGLAVAVSPWQAQSAGSALIEKLSWTDTTRLLLRFFIHLSDGSNAPSNPYHEFLIGMIRSLMKKDCKVSPDVAADVVGEISMRHSALDVLLNRFLDSSTYGNDWTLNGNPEPDRPFRSAAANLIYQFVAGNRSIDPELLSTHSGIFAALAVYQPEITRDWCGKSGTLRHYSVPACWMTIIDHSAGYDSLCLDYCTAIADQNADTAFAVLARLNRQRNDAHLARVVEFASRPQAALRCDAVKLLIEHRNHDVIGIMTRAFEAKDSGGRISGIDDPGYRQLFTLMLERWDQGGQQLLLNLVANYNTYRLPALLTDQLNCLEAIHHPTLREAIHRVLAKLAARDQTDLWRVVSKSHPAAFIADFEEMWVGKSKSLREIAASALAGIRGTAALAEAHELLGSKKSDARLGAAALIEQVCDASSVPFLREALENETSETVRSALHQALKTFGLVEAMSSPASDGAAFDLENFVASQSKGLKLPKIAWLDLGKLPPLPAIDGSALPEAVVMLLIAKQSKHKTLDAAPDILPLLAHIDREKSAPFAAALVEGFLNSEQAAADRWALTLGGLLADNRIIPPLLSRINDWCENSRHKLAEYAAQAISLLPGNEPLMVLDTLSNRYRSKFKNVGKACAEAFNAAASARGITADELGDLVVPDFGFDAEGIRRFDWDGGGASAELGTDFKLTWFDPETEKSWKSLPASAPDEIKNEVKTLTKLLREAVKGQTARLEMTLVRQRRWAVSRWRELYENHPLLRSFASSLVWGVYDASGTLLRTFRRYPNGLLADSAGALEELPETDTMIGMVHPLELDAAALDAWRAHLARFKVKQPFPQIDRPLELLDPLHGNRREIALTNGRKLSAGTFKSRAEKRGWIRGSVVDAGGISSYYKLYPGAGVEVILPTNDFWIGCDPMDTLELCAAYFAKAGSVERGSYVYNEPAPDDPRVLRFDAVPTVVYSETLSDLKAIIETKA